MPNRIKSCIIILTTLVLCACQSSPVVRLYDGEERTQDQIVTVQVPETLSILSINGHRSSALNSSLVSGQRALHLSPGHYEIHAFYREIWEPDSTSTHEVLRSEPVVFTVNGLPGEIHVLEYDKPDTVDDARALAAAFRGWSLNTASAQRMPTTSTAMTAPVTLMGVAMGGAMPAVPSAGVQPKASAEIHNSSVTDDSYLDLLKACWSQASTDEKRAFLHWIAE